MTKSNNNNNIFLIKILDLENFQKIVKDEKILSKVCKETYKGLK